MQSQTRVAIKNKQFHPQSRCFLSKVYVDPQQGKKIVHKIFGGQNSFLGMKFIEAQIFFIVFE